MPDADMLNAVKWDKCFCGTRESRDCPKCATFMELRVCVQ